MKRVRPSLSLRVVNKAQSIDAAKYRHSPCNTTVNVTFRTNKTTILTQRRRLLYLLLAVWFLS